MKTEEAEKLEELAKKWESTAAGVLKYVIAEQVAADQLLLCVIDLRALLKEMS